MAGRENRTTLLAFCGLATFALVAGVTAYGTSSSQLYTTSTVRPRVFVGSAPRASLRQAAAAQSTYYTVPAPVTISAPGSSIDAPVSGTLCVAVMGLAGIAAFLAAKMVSKPTESVALMATTGQRGTWIPGGKPPAHLTGEYPADRGFDPLGLSKDPATFERMRASEVFHCRLAMLGVVGSIIPELQGKGAWYDVVDRQWGPGPNGEVIGFTELSIIALLFIYPLEYWRGNGGFGWGEEKGDRTYPGFDPLNLTSFDTKVAEIKNGRLAMTALLGFAIQHQTTGASPLENLFGSPVAMFATTGERPTWFPGAKAPPHLTGEFPGDRGFDPVDFAADPATFERMRSSEVFHGRLAMLGVAGCLAPELLGKGAWFQAGETTDLAAFGLAALAVIAPLEYWRGNGGFGWDQSEKQKGNRIYPGFDPLKLTSDDTKTKEIKNGRLAMIAFVGLVAQANTTGASPLENLFNPPI